MIYFLVNNDYQLIDARAHVDNLRERGLESVIVIVPHRITLIESGYDEIVIQSPFKGKKRWLAMLFYPILQYLIRRRISVSPRDKLIVYSEYELLNAMLVKFFSVRRADVFLIEDGGFATYTALLDNGRNISKRPVDRFAKGVLQLIFGLDYFCWIDHGGRVTGRIRDDLIKGVLVYRDVKTNRDLKVFEVKPGSHKKNSENHKNQPVPEVAIYLGQDLYNAYMGTSDYRVYLADILGRLSDTYKRVIYKPHPRENLIYVNTVVRELGLDNVAVLDDNSPLETMFQEFPCGIYFSHSSSSCLYLNLEGYTVGFSFRLQNNFDQNEKLRYFMQQLSNFGIKEQGEMVILDRYNPPSLSLFDFLES